MIAFNEPLPNFRKIGLTEKISLFLLVFFLIIFPKGGLKVGHIPITWGYLLLGIVSCFQLLISLNKGTLSICKKPKFLTLLLLLPFQTIAGISFLLNGVESFSFFCAFIVSFYLLPWIFFIILENAIHGMNLNYFIGLLRFALLLIAAFGIIQFFYRIFSGNFIEIPYLTVNAADVGMLDNKFNGRGFVSKLISTYNNGNIYGVSVLIFLPLYALFEKSRWKKFIVKLSLFLTLSRSVWVGLIFFEFANFFYIERKTKRAFFKFFWGFLLVFILVAFSLFLMEERVSFLFDKSLNGRIDQFRDIYNIGLVSTNAFKSIKEITYLSIITNFGVLGLISFIPFMATPLFLSVTGKIKRSGSQYKRALTLGLLTYLVVSCSDGAALYIPVMAFYWFTAELLLSDNLPRQEEFVPKKLKSRRHRRAMPNSLSHDLA